MAKSEAYLGDAFAKAKHKKDHLIYAKQYLDNAIAFINVEIAEERRNQPWCENAKSLRKMLPSEAKNKDATIMKKIEK